MAQRPPEIPSEFAERSSRGGSSYFVIWAIAACFAALYLAVVSVRPAFLEGYLPVASAEHAAQTAADIVNIRDNIGQLQTDVAKAQTDVDQQATATRALSDRVAALEKTAAPAASEPPAAPAEPQRVGSVDFPDGQHSPGPVAEAKSAKPQAKVINAPIETGSVAADAAPPPPKPKPQAAANQQVGAFSEPKVKKPVGIRLATGASVDNLRVSWGILSERHSAELKPLQPRYYNNVDGNGITYELVAGPFKTTADAKKVCQSLKAQAIDCQVSSFGGNAL